jgi:hypothetical protein
VSSNLTASSLNTLRKKWRWTAIFFMEITKNIGTDAERQGVDVSACSDFDSAKLLISSQFGIRSAFLRVVDIARIMGIPANTIHALMRRDRFPIAHRRVGSVVVVKVDDLVEWYCTGDAPPAIAQALVAPSTPPIPRQVELMDIEGDEFDDDFAPAAFEETSKERAARIKREAHDALRRRGLIL